jgi:hypothetical protein
MVYMAAIIDWHSKAVCIYIYLVHRVCWVYWVYWIFHIFIYWDYVLQIALTTTISHFAELNSKFDVNVLKDIPAVLLDFCSLMFGFPWDVLVIIVSLFPLAIVFPVL